MNEDPDFCTGQCSPTAVFLRGGDWANSAIAGVFALHLDGGLSYSNSDRGFRCVYS